MPHQPLILSSSSRYRQQLLARLGLDFSCHSPAIDETPTPNEDPCSLASRLALSKAKAVASQHPNALIIGSDQVASCKDKILGKPGNAANAFAQLQHCSGQRVTFHTGLCLFNAATEQYQLDTVPYYVEFLTLSDLQINAYIKKEAAFDCAGSFKAENLGAALFAKQQGDDPTALIGLPLIRLCAMLRNQGVEPLC